MKSIQDYIDDMPAPIIDSLFCRQVLSLIDLTSLHKTNTPDDIVALCKKSLTVEGRVAAICIYPEFVAAAKKYLTNTSVKVATVVNFPEGNEPDDNVVAAITAAIQAGADEIDLVFPYTRYLAGDKVGAQALLRRCKMLCGKPILLKVIIEASALPSLDCVKQISRDAILAGADFLKTSTGTIKQIVTLAVVGVMLLAIKELSVQCNRPIGLKVSGSIRTPEQAAAFLSLAKVIMGEDWVSPETFRFGASHLLEAVMTGFRE